MMLSHSPASTNSRFEHRLHQAGLRVTVIVDGDSRSLPDVLQLADPPSPLTAVRGRDWPACANASECTAAP